MDLGWERRILVAVCGGEGLPGLVKPHVREAMVKVCGVAAIILSPKVDQGCDLGGRVVNGVVDAATTDDWLAVSRGRWEQWITATRKAVRSKALTVHAGPDEANDHIVLHLVHADCARHHARRGSPALPQSRDSLGLA